MVFTEMDDKMHGMLCNNVYSLRGLLSIDNLKKGYQQTNVKEYYVASILDESIKFLTYIIRWEDGFKEGFDKEKEKTLVGNLIVQGLTDEISMYHRKLIESLINIIHWSQIQDDNYLKYYYLMQEHSATKSKLSDLKEFYGIESQRDRAKLQNLENEIVMLFPAIDESKCFFLDLSKRTTAMNGIEVHWMESSLKYRLKYALKITDDLGKILIGFTYDNYAYASEKIHFNANTDTQHSEAIMVTIRFIFAIINKLTVLCAQWLGVGDLDEFKRVDKVLSEVPTSTAWYTPLLQDIYDLDDYVFTADGKMGRIIEKNISQYGYRTYKILMLDDNGSGIREDYFPAQYFKRIKPKQDLYDMCFKAQPEFKKMYDAEPDEERLKTCLDESIKMVWKLILKEKYIKKK